MCGIAGIWRLDGRPVDPALLDRMTDALAHRGPDGRGTHLDPEAGLGLGHRRLAILDLSPAAAQPMALTEGGTGGRYWIVYNGEIYNFIEIRRELEALGQRFVTDSDTEVILAAYARWGEACQLKFNGMWALAVWDSRERRLFLSRDRFGVKPLHYYFDGRTFAFASEVKAFLALPEVGSSFDEASFALALGQPLVIEGTEHCLLDGVKRLHGGFSLTLAADGRLEERRWWNTLDHLETPPKRPADQVERFRELFLDACRIRLRSDVPLATALSGGLDSSSALCAINHIRRGDGGERLAEDWQTAFVAVFAGTRRDERPFADQVIQATGAKPVYAEIDPAAHLDRLDDILFGFESVHVDLFIGIWALYRAMRERGIVVSLDGHGGDELLGGYGRYIPPALEDALRPWPRPWRYWELTSIRDRLYPKAAVSRSIRQRLGSALDSVRRLAGGDKRRTDSRGLAVGAFPQAGEFLRIAAHPVAYPWFAEDEQRLASGSRLGASLYRDFHMVGLPTVLRNFDRFSMAHGVESRAPLMDWRLAACAFALPDRWKIGRGYTKTILREAMRGLLPEPIRTRTSKIGFANPKSEWLSGPLKPLVLDGVSSKAFQESAVWDGPALGRLAEKGFARGDYGLVSLAWRFVLAARLRKLFKERAAGIGLRGKT